MKLWLMRPVLGAGVASPPQAGWKSEAPVVRSGKSRTFELRFRPDTTRSDLLNISHSAFRISNSPHP